MLRRSRSPGRRDNREQRYDKNPDRDRRRDEPYRRHDEPIRRREVVDRNRDRDHDRKHDGRGETYQKRSRSKSPIIRGPSGVKSKNAVNELLLAEPNDEMAKLMGFSSFERFDKEPNGDNSVGVGNAGGFGNGNDRGFAQSHGFGGRGRGNFGNSRRGFDNGGSFAGRGNYGANRGGNQSYGRNRNDYDDNRSNYRGGGHDRPMHGQSDRGRSSRYIEPPMREYPEERRTVRYRPDDEKNKQELLLINPTHVPRQGGYFEHDNRDPSPRGDDRHARPERRFETTRHGDYNERHRDRDDRMYDPRKDFSRSSNLRDRVSSRGGGYDRSREQAPMGWRNSEFSRGRDNRDNYRNQRESYDEGRRNYSSDVREWKHDMFYKIQNEEDELVEKDSHEEHQDQLPKQAKEKSSRKIEYK